MFDIIRETGIHSLIVQVQVVGVYMYVFLQVLKGKLVEVSQQHTISRSMFVLVLLTHGNEGYVVASDGQRVNLAWIFELFNNVKCPHLLGLPKLFFIDACRGG